MEGISVSNHFERVILIAPIISADATIDVVDNARVKKPHTNGFHFRKTNGSTAGSGTRTPAGEDWELDCEICFRRGINQVGNEELCVVGSPL